jgi:hypothetical protein
MSTTGLAGPPSLAGSIPGLPAGSNVQYQVGYASEDPRVAAYKIGLLEEARNLYNKPLAVPSFEVAGPSTGQIQAADLARQGIGTYTDYLNEGYASLGQGQGMVQAGARLAGELDVAPEYREARSAMQAGLDATGQLSKYSTLAGQGLDEVRSGIGGLQYARGMAPNYMQAGLGSSNTAINQALGIMQGSGGQSDFTREYGILGGAQGTAQQAANEAALAAAGPAEKVTAESFTAPGTAEKMMSPYMQNVVDIQQREALRQDAIARQGRAAQAVRSGAFGGTREGVVEAEAQRNLGTRLGDIQAQGLQQAYQQAQQQFNAEQQAKLAAAQSNQQAGLAVGQLGLQAAAQRFQQAGFDANTAMQMAQLDQTQQQQALQQAQAIQGIGALRGQQALQQAQVGQAGTQLYGSLAAQEAQLGGMLPAQIAQAQAGIDAQRAGLYNTMGLGVGNLAAQRAGIDLQRAGILGQAGAQMAQTGMQQASLGQAAQQMGQADVNMMMGIGAMEQANEQAQIDAIRATTMAETMAPYQQLAFVSDMYRGAPSTQSSLIGTSQPSASPFQTAAGLGIAGVSAAAGAKKVGLL